MRRPTRRALAARLALFALALCAAACGGGEGRAPDSANNAAAASSNAGGGPSANAQGPALDSEIESLERHAERSPSDDVRASLAAAYVRRGDARRAAGDLRSAFEDYQSALRNDPDNEDAQRAVADLKPQVEGEREGEYGEPEPLPITPGVTSGAGSASPTPEPSPRKSRP